jgi:hypothetical protein
MTRIIGKAKPLPLINTDNTDQKKEHAEGGGVTRGIAGNRIA